MCLLCRFVCIGECLCAFGIGHCTDALHMHWLIRMTASATVGEIFSTLVCCSASSAEEQLLAYQINLQLYSACVFEAVSTVSTVLSDSGKQTNKQRTPLEHLLQVNLLLQVLQYWVIVAN